LRNDERHSLYSSPSIVRVIKLRGRGGRDTGTHGGGEGCLRGFVGRPAGKRPLIRPRRRWEDNIKMFFRGIGINGANWIRLAQDRVQWRDFVNTIMNLRVP
jgi:hypothetical protein